MVRATPGSTGMVATTGSPVTSATSRLVRLRPASASMTIPSARVSMAPGGHGAVGRLPVGYFGASTGAAAALVAAARHPEQVTAVMSRGGRPDLAGAWLDRVEAPTLLIVGGLDHPVIDLNREAQRRLNCTCLLEIVASATHLFEETGTLAQAARLAQSWFLSYLAVGVSKAG